MSASPDALGADLFTLSEGAVSEARLLAEILSGPVSDQAARLIDEGFVVPAPEALAHAACVFRSIAGWPGLTPAIQTQEGDEKARLDVVCALGCAVRNAQEQMDLDWASLWVQRIETSVVIRDCMDVFARVNGGQRQWLEAQMRRSMNDRRDHDIWSR